MPSFKNKSSINEASTLGPNSVYRDRHTLSFSLNIVPVLSAVVSEFKVMRDLRKLVLLLVFVLVSGCAATGQGFSGFSTVSDSSGVIVVYRPSRFVMSGAYPYVYLNGEKLSPLKNGGFVSFERKPGIYSLAIKGNKMFWSVRDIETQVEIKPGHRYIYRLEPTIGGVPTVIGSAAYVPIGSNFGQIGEEEALLELRALKSSNE